MVIIMDYAYFRHLITILGENSNTEIDDKISVLEEQVGILQGETSRFFTQLKKAMIHLSILKNQHEKVIESLDEKMNTYQNNVMNHQEKQTNTTAANYMLYRLRHENKKKTYVFGDLQDMERHVTMKFRFYKKVQSDLAIATNEKTKLEDAKDVADWFSTNDYDWSGLTEQDYLIFYEMYVRG